MRAWNEPTQGTALGSADSGDEYVYRSLLERYRRQLRGMVVARLDRRLAARVDASDVVQDVFTDACRGLRSYLRKRPLPFYPWLQQFVKQRVSKLHRDHLRSAKRSLLREQGQIGPVGEIWPPRAGDVPVDSGSSPSGQAVRNEERLRILAVLQRLPVADREVLELRYVQGLSFPEIALRLELGISAVKMRHFRALNQVGTQLDGSSDAPVT